MGPQEKVNTDADAQERDESSQEDLIGHDQEDLDLIRPENGDVVTTNPKLPQRLEAFSVICIICNRMIRKEPFVAYSLFHAFFRWQQ